MFRSSKKYPARDHKQDDDDDGDGDDDEEEEEEDDDDGLNVSRPNVAYIASALATSGVLDDM